ncbi:DNA-binding protein with HTH domain [Caulobacter sp. AP07]|nr:DNA-binding protein with HTH domain [Caulobacter sp. AP07]
MPCPEPLTPILVAELVGGVYEAAFNPRLWRQFVERIETIYPDLRITLFSHDGNGPAADLNVMVNFPEAAYRDYAAHYVSNSPYVNFVPRNQIGLPTRSETIIDDRELFRTEHYNDYLRRHRLGHYGVGMVLEREPQVWTALSFADQRDDEARRDHQMALLDLLAPHLRRALKLRRTLIEARSAAMASQAMFDGWTQATFVLDRDGRVVTMNRRAEALVAHGDDISLNRLGRLRSFDDRCSRVLDAAIVACHAIPGGFARGDTDLSGVMLPRRHGGSPLHAMLWPIASAAELGLPMAAGQILLVVSNPDDTPPTAIAWITRRFGLSPAEERLADAVIGGVPLAEAAERLGIQLSTARTRLKSIQAKTGCHRQLDLVRLAMSVPPLWLG